MILYHVILQFQENVKKGMLSQNERSVRRNLSQAGTAASAVLFIVFLICTGLAEDGGGWIYHLQKQILNTSQRNVYAGTDMGEPDAGTKGRGVDKKKALAWIPLISYAEDQETYDSSIEDEETLAKILEAQANDENAVDENGNLIGEPDESEADTAAVSPTVDTSIKN